MTDKVIRLFGGHRNKVFRIDGKVKIVWKDGFKREKQIREGVLLENFVAVHTDIKSRMLVDKSKPIQEEGGKLVTYFHYAAGEIRYPWNLEEIASAAKLLGEFHSLFRGAQKVQPFGIERLHLNRLHLDFARGNVLFRSGSADAIGIIDFETTSKGLVEQELGRSLSFILVDSQGCDPSKRKDSILPFDDRMDSFLTNYGHPYRKEDVVEWMRRYLEVEDYGSLNEARDKVLKWVLSFRAIRR